MKKSQIMAALALALALGTVAPIAGVIGNASAWEVVDEDSHGKANCNDAAKISTAIKQNSDYKALRTFLDDARVIEKTDVKGFAKLDALTAAHINNLVKPTFATSVLDTFNTLKANATAKIVAGGADVDANVIRDTLVLKDSIKAYTDAGADTDANKLTLKMIKDIIDDAKKVPGYSAWAEIVNVIDKKGKANAKVEDLSASAIHTYNDVYEVNIEADKTVLLKDLPDYSDNNKGNYDKFIDAVDLLEEVYNTYKAQYDIIMNDARVVKANGLFNDQVVAGGVSGVAAYKNLVSDPDGSAANKAYIPKLGDVIDLVFDATTNGVPETADNYILNNVAWDQVFADLWTDLDSCNTKDKTVYTDAKIYGDIIDMMNTYRKVIDVDPATKNYQIAESLLNYSAGTGTAQETDPSAVVADNAQPGTAGVPNTGALGSAKGTATTISIVAGLATALTALGAGVVAYRSARRSK